MSQITTHVLDTSRGSPASKLAIALFRFENESWESVATGITNSDGRIVDLLEQERVLPKGTYKLNFETQSYFDALGEKCFYPSVEIIFSIQDSDHYHVPLLLSAYGYSTYRGS
ncbi:MAG: 5-hydroxyisourate hydrolase [Candidatus Azotimanducaceae bacterium]|jgi:5-hydroxyisourate hydrolase